MSTQRSFQAMLNEYLPNSLLKEEMIKRDWLLNKVEKDDSWLGGDLIVPFEGAGASSIKFGGLTANTDISEDAFVRGRVSGQPEVWGTMIFQERDLMEHNKLSEQNLLKILPNRVDAFLGRMKEAVSVNLLCGPHFATGTVDGTVGGVVGVDHPERFAIGQHAVIIDGNSPQLDVYVIGIDMNASTVTLSLTRGGVAADMSAYSVAQNTKFYHDGILSGGVPTGVFTSLRNSLLSAANGGSASLYGQSKLAYPYLQAINVDGSTMGITATTILTALFDAYTKVRTVGKGNANTIVMSYKHLGSIMKIIESQKSAFKVTPEATSASLYGWSEIEITSVKGKLTLVGVQEMDNDVIFFLDMSAFKFYSNGFFKKRKSPDGVEYFTQRGTTGYSYIVDISLFGDMILEKPGTCAVLCKIPNY